MPASCCGWLQWSQSIIRLQQVQQPSSSPNSPLACYYTIHCFVLHIIDVKRKTNYAWQWISIRFLMAIIIDSPYIATVICKLSRKHAIQPRFLLCMNNLRDSDIKRWRPPCISLRVQAAQGVHNLKWQRYIGQDEDAKSTMLIYNARVPTQHFPIL